MTHIRYTPWSVRPASNDQIRNAFERFLGAGAAAPTTGSWTPRVDIREDEERFVLLVDVPGIDPQAVEVQMDKNVLTIKGERLADADAAKRYSRVERPHGTFERRFTLPDSADADGITATGRHGVLEISIPKKAQTQPRRIQVQ